VPIVARWQGNEIEIILGPPLAAGPAAASTAAAAHPGEIADEAALAGAAATWLERYLLASPAELGLGLLRDLLAAEIAAPIR
jgi:hypothetical protein